MNQQHEETRIPRAPVVHRVAKAMEEYILSSGGVSMVELERVAGEHIEVSGDLAWAPAAEPNLIIWAGMSQDFIDAVDLMRECERVEPTLTTPLVYTIDGKMLNLPVAQRPPKGGYKSEHWAPVVFNPASPASARTKRPA